MSCKFYKGWYALYVKSRTEKKVDKLLTQNLLEVYLPLVKKVKKWSDRKKVVHEPIFPSYLFVYLRDQKDFARALSVDGAYAFIRFGSEYARVREEEIQNIKTLLKGDFQNIETSSALPQIGEVKKIRYGLLQGLECEVIKVNNVNKILVRVDSIHMNITAVMPMAYLQGSLSA